MEQVTYPAIITQTASLTKIYFPDLPDASVEDADYDRALLRAKIGLALIISDLQSHHERVPQPGSNKHYPRSPKDKIMLIQTDLDQYWLLDLANHDKIVGIE